MLRTREGGELRPRSARGGPRATNALKATLSIAIIAIVFAVVLPRVVDLGDVWRVLTQMTWLEATTLAMAAAWNLVTYWLLMMAALPGLGLARAMVATETSTAIANMVPGGPALGMGATYSMYASWGFPRPAVALAITVSGSADLLAKLVMPAAALLFIALAGDTSPGLVAAAVAGLVLLSALGMLVWMTLHSDATARRAGRILAGAAAPLLRRRGKPPPRWEEALVTFRREAIALLAARRWHLLAASLISHISLFFVLLLALRHVGVSQEQVGWEEALAAFAFVRFLSAFPLTPGGLGIIELGLTAALAYAGGPRVEVVAAVLVFRALTYLVQIPFGAITYAYWQHSRRWQRAPSVEGGEPRVG
ncbi:MAG TPA: YbhN family protein [Actinomycetota bacterium]|nr:YbhN family protein [Actinomycetota bacterium]